MSNFVIEFPLKTEIYQEHILDKRFNIGRTIYNALINITQKRYQEMIKTKEYRHFISQLTKDKEKNKPIWKEINKLEKSFNLNEYAFHRDVQKMQRHFKNNIDTFTAQKLASNLWKAYDKLLHGEGKTIRFKKYGQLNTLEGKSNNTGIRFKNNFVYWNKLKIPVIIDYGNYYEYQSMQNEISYCRIVRKFIKKKYKYYVQIVFKGIPPVKIDNLTGEIKRHLGNGSVGIDIGTSTIAYSSDTDVKIIELADKVQNIENQKRRLLRKMDRSRRATNPNNFNEDGTVKKQGSRKVVWIKSNHYLNCQKQLRTLYRKQAAMRKYQHECLANEIIKLGDKFYVEEMNFKALQKKSKKTEVSEKTGKFKKKKRFGKSIANRAPAMLLDTINRKLSYYGVQLIEIDTKNAKASQYNHFEDDYRKKKLSQRWNNFNGIKVQRDLYSSFLIKNVNDDLKSINLTKCNETFDNFFKLHNLEVERLSNHKNLSCIAI